MMGHLQSKGKKNEGLGLRSVLAFGGGRTGANKGGDLALLKGEDRLLDYELPKLRRVAFGRKSFVLFERGTFRGGKIEKVHFSARHAEVLSKKIGESPWVTDFYFEGRRLLRGGVPNYQNRSGNILARGKREGLYDARAGRM